MSFARANGHVAPVLNPRRVMLKTGHEEADKLRDAALKLIIRIGQLGDTRNLETARLKDKAVGDVESAVGWALKVLR